MIERHSVTKADESFLFQVFKETREEEMRAIGWDMEECETFLRMQFDMQKRSYALQFPSADHEIIRLDKMRVGQILTEITDQSIRVIDISLLADYRNKGIGTHLISDIQARAEVMEKAVQLHVMYNNPAQNLYERLGFHVTGEKMPYLAMEWQAGK